MRNHTPSARRDAPHTARSTRRPGQRRRMDPCVPEWQTVEWKHRVEAEARRRLKRELRGESVR
jgi:hypothetical protein